MLLGTHRDREMSSRSKISNPATIAVLILFAGSSSAAPAIADDRDAFDANEASSAQIEETSKEQARRANEAAVEEAARSVEADTRLDLDIRLIGRTSMIIAGEA